jgi:hypothetical protein
VRGTGWLLWSWPEGVGVGIHHVFGSPDALHEPRHQPPGRIMAVSRSTFQPFMGEPLA